MGKIPYSSHVFALPISYTFYFLIKKKEERNIWILGVEYIKEREIRENDAYTSLHLRKKRVRSTKF